MSTMCYRGSCHTSDVLSRQLSHQRRVIAAVVMSTLCYRGSCHDNDVLSRQLSHQRCVIVAVVMSTMCYHGSCHTSDVLSRQLSHQRCVIAAVVMSTKCYRGSCHTNNVLSRQLSCQRCMIAGCHVNDVLSRQLSHQRCMIAGRHHSPRSGQAELLAAFRARQSSSGSAFRWLVVRQRAAMGRPTRPRTPVQLPVLPGRPDHRALMKGRRRGGNLCRLIPGTVLFRTAM